MCRGYLSNGELYETKSSQTNRMVWPAVLTLVSCVHWFKMISHCCGEGDDSGTLQTFRHLSNAP